MRYTLELVDTSRGRIRATLTQVKTYENIENPRRRLREVVLFRGNIPGEFGPTLTLDLSTLTYCLQIVCDEVDPWRAPEVEQLTLGVQGDEHADGYPGQ